VVLQDADITARVRLAAPQAAEPGTAGQFLQCSFHRFNLVDPVIPADSFGAVFPQAAVPRLQPGGAVFGADDFQVQFQPLNQAVDKLVGFRKQVAGIDQHHRDAGRLPGNHVQHHRGLGAEARRQQVVWRQVLQRPFDPLGRAHALQAGIHGGQLRGFPHLARLGNA